MSMDSAKRVASGTWGEVWLDGEYVAECYGLQAKMSFTKEKIAIARQMATDSKIVAMEGTGTLKLHKATSRMGRAVGGKISDGVDVRYTIVSKLDDPDAYGAERVVISNVSFDDLTLADWEAAKVGTIEVPFTFTEYKYLDFMGG